RRWDYEFLYFALESSDENLINVTSRLEHEELGKQYFYAVIDWKHMCNETTRFQGKAYFSQSGRDEDYRVLPYNIPNISFEVFFGQYYKQLIHSELGNCSNLPTFDEFALFCKKATFVFNKCRPSMNAFPEMLPRGYYKIVFQIIGEAVLTFSAITKVVPIDL
ncbi:hypothetical protein KR093_009558, partial [Drosophila rubida]